MTGGSLLVISVLWLIKTYIHRMKKKRVLEVFIVETKGGLMFSHKDISGKTTLYDSYKLTTITELGGIDTKQPERNKECSLSCLAAGQCPFLSGRAWSPKHSARAHCLADQRGTW